MWSGLILTTIVNMKSPIYLSIVHVELLKGNIHLFLETILKIK